MSLKSVTWLTTLAFGAFLCCSGPGFRLIFAVLGDAQIRTFQLGGAFERSAPIFLRFGRPQRPTYGHI